MEPRTKRISFNDLRRKEDSEDDEDDESRNIRQNSDVISDEEEKNHSRIFKARFNRWKELLLSILIIFYVADIGLDVWVAARFFTFKHPKNGWFVIFCILVPNLYAGYKSLQWYLRAHDHDPIRNPLPWVIRIAFFPVSLLLRYYDTWKFGHESRVASRNHDNNAEIRLFSSYLIESSEVSMLRLFTIFLEDAPIAVLNLKNVILTPPEIQKHKMEMVLVVIFKLVFTMTFGVVHFLTSTKAVYHAAKSEHYFLMGAQWVQKENKEDWQHRAFLSLKAEICIYFWHLCAIGSRLVAYAMFIAVYQSQLWILLLIRWVINVVWIKYDAWEISLTNCIAFGGVYLFSFVPVSPKRQLLRVLVYYTFTTIENIVISVLFRHAMGSNPYGSGAFAFVFGGAFLGMVFMSLYYGLFHPARPHSDFFDWFKEKRFRVSGAA